MPSVSSLGKKQYYAHKQNHFWKILAQIFNEPMPTSYLQKKALLGRSHIGLWDVIGSCIRKTSADSTIRAVKVNNIRSLFKKYASLERVLCNGKTAYHLFEKNFKDCSIPYDYVPSSSPALAKPLSWKVSAWKEKISH